MRSLLLRAFLLLLLAVGGTASSQATASGTVETQSLHTVWLPLVTTGLPPCNASAEEAALATLIRSHPEQQRPSMTCHPLLQDLARAHARDMAVNRFVGHVNLAGIGPDERVRRAGYRLPAWYGSDLAANTVESLSVGGINANFTWRGLVASTVHNSHLLGKTGVAAQQTYYGVGFAYVPGSEREFYWVIVTAPPPNATVLQP